VIGLRRALWTIAIAAVVVIVAGTWLLAESASPDPGLWIALNLVIGGGFVGVGLFAWYRRPDNRVGTLMVATGFAWFVSVFVRTEPPLLFSIGLLLSNLFVATAVHLLLSFPSGRLRDSKDRALVWFAYLVTTVGFLPWALTFDPAEKVADCPSCPENVFLIDANATFAATYVDFLGVVGVIFLLGVLGRLVGRWRAATPPMRRVVTPVLAAGATLMAMLALVVALDVVGASHDFVNDAYYATLIPFGLVPYLFLGVLARARMLRGGAVGELVARIGGPLGGGELRDALARALNDPSLELAYWLPDSECHVDPAGHRMEPPAPGSGRATSYVTLEGERVAVLVHDPLLLDEPELIEAVGAAAALALERERLDAELRAKVGELHESRARLLSIELAERGRLERDLHDGAQQRLVSLALDLRLARGAVREDPEQAERLLDGAGKELEHALGELRELARGIHPAVLSDRGLDPAVEALALRAPLPVEIVERLGERVPKPVELAAYFVVSEALTNVAKYAQASRALVRVGRENGRVVVEVADDGVGGADPKRGSGLRGLADRVSALGGRLEVASGAGSGTTVTARIPCE
jgi:signal transduction histidine kinase